MNLMRRIRHIPHGADSIREWLGCNPVAEKPEVSEARAKICADCNRNVDSWFLTETIANAIKRHLEVKNALKLKTSYDDQLGTCAVCTCELKLLVHEPLALVQSQLTEEEMSQYPSHCWKLREHP